MQMCVWMLKFSGFECLRTHKHCARTCPVWSHPTAACWDKPRMRVSGVLLCTRRKWGGYFTSSINIFPEIYLNIFQTKHTFHRNFTCLRRQSVPECQVTQRTRGSWLLGVLDGESVLARPRHHLRCVVVKGETFWKVFKSHLAELCEAAAAGRLKCACAWIDGPETGGQFSQQVSSAQFRSNPGTVCLKREHESIRRSE